MSQELSITIEIIVALAAFSGMGLGFYNLWNEKQKDKVKLKVIPKSIKHKGENNIGQTYILTTSNEFNINSSQGLYAFEVINFSKFAITVGEVGFLNSKTNGRSSMSAPILYDDGVWPRKLEPRESVTLYADLASILDMKHLPYVNTAFALTTCDHMEKGSSDSLVQLVEHSKSHA